MRLSPEEVGQRVREARLAHGWTHEELARRMGVNWRTVQRWQNGQLPKMQTLLRLAEVLNVPAGYLIEPDASADELGELRAQVEELTERLDALARALDRQEPARPAARPQSR
jgi:transcriptional regulator with XRE-family HTH domain